MKRIRDELGYSYPLIGRIFGRDHVTVIWACRGGRKNQPSMAKLREIAA
jgi:chromosomal replication initiation ATPase DnaA